jgi:hypothetical protein
MVLPGDELKVNIRCIGMRDGNIVVGIDAVNDRGEKVLEGSAEVAQPTTVRAPGNRVWVWIFITTFLLLALSGRQQTVIFSPFMGSLSWISSKTTPKKRLSTSVVLKVKPFASGTWI